MSDLSSPEEKQKMAEEKYVKGVQRFDMGDFDEALMLMRAALALWPGNFKYHYNIAYVYWKNDMLEVAINHYKMFIRYAHKNDPDVHIIKDRIKMLEKEILKRRNMR